MSGEGFQFTPFGVQPLGVSLAPPVDVAGGSVHATQQATVVQPSVPVTAHVAAQSVAPVTAPTPAVQQAAPKTAPAKPRDIVRAAKARIREIRAELRAKRALERELSELERLVNAAAQKPTASIRHIRNAG